MLVPEKILLVGTVDLDVTKNCEPRVAGFEAATAIMLVAIRTASRTQAATILATQRPRGQRQQHLFANQRRQINHISIVQREFEVLGAQTGIAVVTNRARRKDVTKATSARRDEFLGTARAGGDRRGRELPAKENFGARAIVGQRDIHRSFQAIFPDRSEAECAVNFPFRLGKGKLLRIGRNIIYPELHGQSAHSVRGATWDYYMSSIEVKAPDL